MNANRAAKILSKIYGEPCRLSRTYLCRDGRKRLDVIFSTWKKTYQLARVKLEIKLRRRLEKWEDADHKDGDHTNDRFSNLQVLTKVENAAKAARRRKVKRIRCIECQNKFRPTRHQTDARARKKAGPFCSRKCSGRYGKEIQLGYRKRSRSKTKVTYYSRNTGIERRVG